jgi:Epoxide hydrolase N terminus
MVMRPFEISFSAEMISDLRLRIERTRWPELSFHVGWERGTDDATLRGLAGYWLEGYDVAAIKERLNRLHHLRRPRPPPPREPRAAWRAAPGRPRQPHRPTPPTTRGEGDGCRCLITSPATPTSSAATDASAPTWVAYLDSLPVGELASLLGELPSGRHQPFGLGVLMIALNEESQAGGNTDDGSCRQSDPREPGSPPRAARGRGGLRRVGSPDRLARRRVAPRRARRAVRRRRSSHVRHRSGRVSSRREGSVDRPRAP